MDPSQIGHADWPFAEAEAWLHERARAAAGLADFGDDEYLEGLRRWLKSLDADADLSPAGRQMTLGITLTALTGRLQSQASLEAHPESRNVRIEAPIVILGLPRTGTTALHKMLCNDPRNQGLELWLPRTRCRARHGRVGKRSLPSSAPSRCRQ